MVCPLCKKESVWHYCESHTDSGIEYKLYECSLCHAQFWTPLKNPGSEWYERDFRYVGLNKDPILKPIWNHRKVIHFLKPFTGTVLDVGCGTGSFLYNAKMNGWKTTGIDFDRSAITAAQKVFNLDNVEVNDLAGFYEKNKNTKFDLVTFFDVFEHIDNHNEFIEMVRAMLTDKGYVAMSMPYRYGAHWLQPYDLPPRHLTRWDRRALKTFLEAHGFSIKYITRRSEGIRIIVLKLRFKYGKYVSFNLVNKVKDKARTEGAIVIGSSTEKKVSRIRQLAKIKDYIVFGLPATAIWLVMFFTKKRYITLYAIAQKKS
jgi:SAM-dependent methyltransferase